MWELLSKERKILLGVTVVVFIVSATLIWQTYETMKTFNAADAICTGIKPDMTASQVKTIATQQQIPLAYQKSAGAEKITLGFNTNRSESCGCEIDLKNNRVIRVNDTYCQRSSNTN